MHSMTSTGALRLPKALSAQAGRHLVAGLSKLYRKEREGRLMSTTASEVRKALFPLIKKVNDDHEAIEIVSKHGDCSRRTRTPWANINVSERELIDPDAANPAEGAA
ncbi:hypothetical protein ACFYW8_15065 [Streptomyces sp. NPDC002742]|uniref:hypothetical protein n=1 Tax=Streptomyces sp. NPDC002742 TaxID=3364663 RepID=UPI00367953BF